MENAQPKDTTPQHDMMMGTGGQADYLLVARKGSIGLGLKPNVIAPGDAKDTTYIGARIRSAMLPDSMVPQDTVVSISHMSLTLDSAWPGVTWEKANSERASTQISMHLRGTPDTNPELLLAAMADQKLARDMADYLIGIVGEENLHISREELIAWIDTIYAPAATMIQRKAAAGRKVEEEIESAIGVFGMQAAMMKKVYDAMSEGSDIPDLPEAEDGEG